MGLPDFLCIGAQKAGTSWLNNVLLEHPQVFMPPVNELHFFDRVGKDAPLRKRQVRLANRAIQREKRKKDQANQAYIDYLTQMISFPTVSLEWYRAAYAWPVGEGVKTGDITPSYIELPEKQVAFARELLGPAKLILIVRRPAERLLSQLRMWAARDDRTDVPQTEEEWAALLREVTQKERRGAYSRGIPLWRNHFGAENLLILPFSDMRTDPRGMISRIEDHIGVPRFKDYTLLTTQIHVTKKLEIPAAVRQAAVELNASEDDYIRQEFGEEFFDKTK